MANVTKKLCIQEQVNISNQNNSNVISEQENSRKISNNNELKKIVLTRSNSMLKISRSSSHRALRIPELTMN